LRVVDCGSVPKFIMSRGFHTGDPTINERKEKIQWKPYMKKYEIFSFWFCRT